MEVFKEVYMCMLFIISFIFGEQAYHFFLRFSILSVVLHIPFLLMGIRLAFIDLALILSCFFGEYGAYIRFLMWIGIALILELHIFLSYVLNLMS